MHKHPLKIHQELSNPIPKSVTQSTIPCSLGISLSKSGKKGNSFIAKNPRRTFPIKFLTLSKNPILGIERPSFFASFVADGFASNRSSFAFLFLFSVCLLVVSDCFFSIEFSLPRIFSIRITLDCMVTSCFLVT